MKNFNININWLTSDDKYSLQRHTTAALTMLVNGNNLTKNINIWSKKEEDSVVVSTYPLAHWFAFNWWRLANEFLPLKKGLPDYDWRCAHELGAVDHGYVWPKALFVSDGESMNIWSELIPMPEQSVNYIEKLDTVQAVPLKEFQNEVATLINETITKLGDQHSELSELWKIVCDDMENKEIKNIRELEAALGFDPEECPVLLMKKVLAWQKRVGTSSIMEIVPYVPSNKELQHSISYSHGMEIHLSGIKNTITVAYPDKILPWQKGVGVAKQLRQVYGLGDKKIQNEQLLDLLGLPSTGIDKYDSFAKDIPLSIGKNNDHDGWSFVPKSKKSLNGKRFELARMLGDALTYDKSQQEWLVASECSTARQKMQRAFAAEFLCPHDVLVDFMDGNYSKSRQEAASRHFQVSEKTIHNILMDYSLIGHTEVGFPYREMS